MRCLSCAACALLLALPLVLACSRAAPATSESGIASADPSASPMPIYTYEVRESFPHDRAAFTQGLELYDGALLESTGQYGASTLRRVELKTGRVVKLVNVPAEYFAEGLTVFGGRIFQLTWQAHKGFIYDPESFQKLGEFTYEGEGWGLTHDGESLIMSDGTNRIRFLDPSDFKVRRSIKVFDGERPLMELNELEYVRGEIYANVWQTNRIARINPQTGQLVGWIDLTGLLKMENDPLALPVDVLNGIAYDERGNHLYVTGKLWPKLYEIKLKRKR